MLSEHCSHTKLVLNIKILTYVFQTCPEHQLDLNCSKVDQKYEENQTQGVKMLSTGL